MVLCCGAAFHLTNSSDRVGKWGKISCFSGVAQLKSSQVKWINKLNVEKWHLKLSLSTATMFHTTTVCLTNDYELFWQHNMNNETKFYIIPHFMYNIIWANGKYCMWTMALSITFTSLCEWSEKNAMKKGIMWMTECCPFNSLNKPLMLSMSSQKMSWLCQPVQLKRQTKKTRHSVIVRVSPVRSKAVWFWQKSAWENVS